MAIDNAKESLFRFGQGYISFCYTANNSWETFCTALSNFFVLDRFTSANVEGSFLIEDINQEKFDKGKGEALLVCGRESLLKGKENLNL